LSLTSKTDPAALCLLATNAIKRKARINSDVAQSQTNGNLAAYVPQWLFGLTVLRLKIQNGTAKSNGIATNAAYTKRLRDWSSRVHKQFLVAVKTQSLLPQISPQDDSNWDQDQAIRSLLAQAMEQQATKTTAATTLTKNKGFNAFPLVTQKMVLATQKDEHRQTPTEPTKQMQTKLDFPNILFIVSHLHLFLRNKRGSAVRFPTGSFCTAIKNGTFLENFTDAPGAMSIFCFGPQTTSTTNVKTATAGNDPEAIAQMQLKLTDTSTGLSDKDIKTMTKLVYTVPRNFNDLADICQVMAGVHKMIFGKASPLTIMLSNLFLYITGSSGNRDSNDTWQTFIDNTTKSGPIPNMCCPYYLNRI
jgi:hypothetical protein